jgi:hypothetical protein
MAEFEESEPEHFRWVAVVTYRAEAGPIEIDHHFEELEELQGIIERGPGLEHDRDDCRAVEPRLTRRHDRGRRAALRGGRRSESLK